ncbi:hypothetical protein AO368_0285 [Moraxella catarrhalis]|nr:hypothetical protein AO368_0285 [Moraxella catarrhalis]
MRFTLHDRTGRLEKALLGFDIRGQTSRPHRSLRNRLSHLN